MKIRTPYKTKRKIQNEWQPSPKDISVVLFWGSTYDGTKLYYNRKNRDKVLIVAKVYKLPEQVETSNIPYLLDKNENWGG